ncbi:hypothetical protein CAEBREN_22455 [Caenorhabditis brenneri]|uniref:Uncharacterized protein n=1 Tax=Caenorhabditis brenneri TaxID=135651 RepID=G0P717_CAEBE|nr:hypothetical protein CAEBREN_22455 [Caenorhabditis brenneri]
MDHFEEEGAYQLEGVGENDWNSVDFPMNGQHRRDIWNVELSSCVDNSISNGTETSQDPSTFVDLPNLTHENSPNGHLLANKTKYEMKQQKRKERYHQLTPKDRFMFNYRNRYHVDPRKTKLTKEEEGKIKRVKTRNAMDTWQRRQKSNLGEQENPEQSGNELEESSTVTESSSCELADVSTEIMCIEINFLSIQDHSLVLESDQPKTLNDLLIRKNALDRGDPYFWRKLRHPPLTPEERRLKHDEQRRKKYRESKTEIYAPREAILQESETARGAVMKEEGRRVNEQDSIAAPHEQATWDSHGNIGYVYTDNEL